MAGHVFISHGSENRDEANELCGFIEARGVKCWIAPRDVRPGIDYSEELQAAIETCAAFVVLVTDMANKSPYVRAETEMAFSCHKPIFPVREADIKPAAGLALFLKIRHWTDAYGKSRDAAMDRLALELQTVVGVAPTGPAPAPAPVPPPSPAPAAPPPLAAPLPPAPAPAPAQAPAPTMAPNQERLEAAIGPKAGWYLARWQQMDAKRSQLSWNWAACLCNMFWFGYRKMWLPTIALALVFLALNVLTLLSPSLMAAGGILSILAVTATGALGTSFYRQQVMRLVRETAGMEQEAALAQLRARGGVSKAAVIGLCLYGIALGGGAAWYGWRQAQQQQQQQQQEQQQQNKPVTEDPLGISPRAGDLGDNPQGTNPGTLPGANVPGIGPNGEIDEQALRNAMDEARNMLEQQGVSQEQLQQIPSY